MTDNRPTLLSVNYRPALLTWVQGSIMESIVKGKLWVILDENNNIRKGQHGFMTGRSCLTNLREVFEFRTKALVEGRDISDIRSDPGSGWILAIQ